MKRIYTNLIAAIAIMMLFASGTRAQFDSDAQRKSFSFEPAPKSTCDWHLITEASVLYQVSRTNHAVNSSSTLFSWQVGAMANTAMHTGWGWAIQVGLGSRKIRVGTGPVLRQWMSRRAFADFTGGLILWGKENGNWMTGRGLYMQAGLGIYQHISIITRLEHMSLEYPIPVDGWPMGKGKGTNMFYGGVNVGGREGAVFCVAAGIIGAVYLVAFRNANKISY